MPMAACVDRGTAKNALSRKRTLPYPRVVTHGMPRISFRRNKQAEISTQKQERKNKIGGSVPMC